MTRCRWRRRPCSRRVWPIRAVWSIEKSKSPSAIRGMAVATLSKRTAGFLPPTDTQKRFVVAWNGLIYLAKSVGKPADLSADVASDAKTQQFHGHEFRRSCVSECSDGGAVENGAAVAFGKGRIRPENPAAATRLQCRSVFDTGQRLGVERF